MKYNLSQDCEKRLTQIKQYLANPPILMPPIYGKPLILYISATKTYLGILLAQEDNDNKERSIHYLSHTLISYEMNYSIIEKAFLVIVFASQKLRHFMLAYTTRLMAKIDPLKYLLSKVALIGRLAKWVMILSEFDIQYVEKKAIKGQVISDQLVEAPVQSLLPLNIDFPNESILKITHQTWVMFFDSSFTQHGSSTRLLFITP